MSLAVFIQYVLPHRLLSHLARWFAYCRFKPWKDGLIRLAVAKFDINVARFSGKSVRRGLCCSNPD